MSTRLRDLMMGELDALRHEPTDKRIRGTLGGSTVVDSTRALLVWEPKRVVPSYAVPAADVAAELVPADEPVDDPAGIPPARRGSATGPCWTRASRSPSTPPPDSR